MKVAAAGVRSYLKKPDPKAQAILIYGPDHGLVRENFDILTRTVVDDLTDPFRVAEFTAGQLKDDPARLADEAAAMSMTGGRRVVRVTEGTDGITKYFKTFLADPKGDALILVNGGELSARSSLRKLFEGAGNAAALPCYGDEGRNLDEVIRETLSKHGVNADPDAITYLIRFLGGDRLMTRQELEKLALFKGNKGTATLEDAMACVGDSANLSMDDLAMAVADGNVTTVNRVLDRLIREGTSPIAVIRAVSRHFSRLHLSAGHISQGKSPDMAMKSLRPPVFFKNGDRFRRQLQHWPPGRLAQALQHLTDAEADCKTTGYPDTAICNRVMIQLAKAGQPRR